MSDLRVIDPRLLNALASLNRIGMTINRIGPGDAAHIDVTLNLIVESAIKVVPGSSAVIYIYDEAQRAFDPTSRLSAGERTPPVPWDRPRPNGMGNRAIEQRRRILSYEEDLEIHPVKVDAGARAVACFPLIVAEQAVGALYIYLHEERTFSELELLLLESFVNQTAMAIYHARQVASIQRDLARREEEFARLRRAGLLISSRPRLKETLEAILEMALEVIDAQYGNFLLVDERGKDLVIAAVAGDRLSRPYMDNIPLDSASVTSWVARNREPVCIPDLSVEPWASNYFPFDHDLEMRAELAVPLISASGRLEGVLNLESPLVGAFSERDNHLLQALATQAVITIQEVLLLDALKDITERLVIQPHEQVLEQLVELATDLLNAHASTIWALEGNTLVLRASSIDLRQTERLPVADSLVGQAVIRKKPILVEDVQTNPHFHRLDLAQEYGWTHALIVPLLAGDAQEPTGAFGVFSTAVEPGRYARSDWEKKVLTILADYAALAILSTVRQEALQAAREQHIAAETFAALGDVAANLLHQLNNKVGTIPVRVQGIEDKSGPALAADPYLAANLAEIERSAREAMRAVRDNLTLLNPIEPVPIHVATCVREAVARADVPGEVCVEVEGLEMLPPVMAGQHSLTMVFINLLENASNAMGGMGRVTIRGYERDEWVKVEVHDTGPGIDRQLQDQIFEFSFSRENAAQPEKLGFGLWWIKTLMARLGGAVTVESDGQHGTTFRLKFPRRRETGAQEGL
jgi:GAF domain-containing protein